MKGARQPKRRQAPNPTKNKHVLLSFQIPTHGFTVDVSVFEGTPPTKPLEMEIRLRRPGTPLA